MVMMNDTYTLYSYPWLAAKGSRRLQPWVVICGAAGVQVAAAEEAVAPVAAWVPPYPVEVAETTRGRWLLTSARDPRQELPSTNHRYPHNCVLIL